jgi:hypothetical protein
MNEEPNQNPMAEESLHMLLAGGRLSGQQRDRILERVLDAQARPQRRFGWWTVGLAAALPVAAVVALALRGSVEAPKGTPGEWLAPRGELSGPLLVASCAGRAPGECRTGDRLVFEVEDTGQGGYFAAYAECEARERIWYFPNDDGAWPLIPPSTPHFVLPQAARIGPEHGQGRCTLRLFVLENRADRSSLAAGSARPRVRRETTLGVAP